MKLVKNIRQLGLTPSSKVMVFMPHPDDEAVFTSGLIQKILAAGIPLRCLTFTRGEKSTLRYTLKPQDDLSTIRTKEQTNAYHTLGVTDYAILDYPDGSLEKHQQSIETQIKTEITTFGATHLITLEPDGIYGHPDHIALSKFVTQSAGDIHVLYATVSPHFIMPNARSMAKKSQIHPLKPDFRLMLTLPEARIKIQTLLCHASQFKQFPQLLLTSLHFLLNDLLFHEYYAYYKGKQ